MSSEIRLLVAPMAVAVETAGPFARARALAVAAREQGHAVAFCAAEDPNYRPVDGVPNYVAPIPSPYGTPLPVGMLLFRGALFLFRYHELAVTSFEQALHILGATAKGFFARDVEQLRRAIQAHRADAVFAVERPAAIVAAKLEHVKALTSFSLPLGRAFAANPEYSRGVNAVLLANHLPPVESVLDLFDWADRKVVPSSPELEPLTGDRVVYVGPFQDIERPAVAIPMAQRRTIVAYTGSGATSPTRLIRALDEAFAGGEEYEVYLSTKEVKPFTRGTMHVDRWFDFNKLLPEAVVSIHHGGQNSVVSSLVHGVPQIVSPGRHYERRFNGASVEQVHAGVVLEAGDITPQRLRQLVTEFAGDPSFARHARDAGERLLGLGGLPRILEVVQEK